MINLGFKKEQRARKATRAEKTVNLDVKKVLGSADQGLILMVRG